MNCYIYIIYVFYVLFSKLLIIVCTSRKRTNVCTSGSIPQIPKKWDKNHKIFFLKFFLFILFFICSPQVQHQPDFRLIKFLRDQGFSKKYCTFIENFFLTMEFFNRFIGVFIRFVFNRSGKAFHTIHGFDCVKPTMPTSPSQIFSD